MAFPLILYDSFLTDSTTTITDLGTESGYAIANIKDLKAYTFWKSNQTAAAINIDIDTGAGTEGNADHIAIVSHNLYTLGATIRIFADAAVIGTTEVLAATTPTEDTVTYLPFTAPGVKRYWRVTINHAALPFAAKPFAACIQLGLKTTLPEYLAPSFDPFFKGVEIRGSRSETGHYLGGVSRGQRHRGNITFGDAGAARASFTSDLNAFIDNHALLRKPFIFILDSGDSDFDSGRYVRVTDGGSIDRMAVGGSWTRLTFSLPIEEAFVETA